MYIDSSSGMKYLLLEPSFQLPKTTDVLAGVPVLLYNLAAAVKLAKEPVEELILELFLEPFSI